MFNIVIFASGSGTNAQRITEYFSTNKKVNIKRIYSNNKEAGVLLRADNLDVPSVVFNRKSFYEEDTVLNLLQEDKPDLIVLAGFLWLIPENLIKNYPGKIINIHPALLPKYGGKGMYGHHVHDSVIENNETESGITIHFVNNKYDEGEIILQERCNVYPDDKPETLASRIHGLEYKYFPLVIEKLLFND